MTSYYKQEETTLRKIIHDNVKPLEPVKTIKLQFFYKNKKLKRLLIKNSIEMREDFCVVYQYKYDKVPCLETKTPYIGRTTTTIKERMKQHMGIKFHHNTIHKPNITGKRMLENVTALARSNNRTDLGILEAFLIKQQ